MHRKGFEIGPGIDAGHLEKMLLARKVGVFLTKMDHDDTERAVVHKLARMLAADISAEVRQALAFELRRSSALPRDLAFTIAKDVEDVAAPFLEMTDVFEEEDWLELIEELEEFALVAIARRSDLTPLICEKMVDLAAEKPITVLIRNQRAPLSVAAFEKVLDRFDGEGQMLELVALRENLPLDIAHRIAEKVSSEIQTRLLDRFEDDEKEIEQVVKAAPLSTLINWLQTASRYRIDCYVRDLDNRGALTDRHLIDVCQQGDLRLLESAVAFKTGLPLLNVEKIVRSGLERGLDRLFRKARFAEGTNSLLRAAVRFNLTKADRA